MSFKEYKKTEHRYRAFFTRARPESDTTACDTQESGLTESGAAESAQPASHLTESARTASARTKRAFILIPARNTLNTLALFRGALLAGHMVGMVEEGAVSALKTCEVKTPWGDRLFIARTAAPIRPGLVCFTAGSTGAAKAVYRTYESWRRSSHCSRILTVI